jgi:hypothetical protein
MKRLASIACLVAIVLAAPASAYYHFIHYLNGVVAPEKFDLSVVPGKTVTFFVSEAGPSNYASTDTFNSVLSQLRQAAAVWNAVPTSDLRVAFGGLENISTPQNTPGGDIVFEDLPPGVYGYGGPSSLATPVTTANGSTFVPILRATAHLNRNLALAPGPSYNETFFMTAVHEMGHALGLQHTFTSATMSQATTRATTLSHPLDTDDIAGISLLYPTAGFSQFGSISGRITSGGSPVHLSSVVAIRAGGGAISALTASDGTYRIDGIPPGQYFVYAHPLPPDADIKGPWNQAGNVVAASGATNALFYPGTTSLTNAAPVSVQANEVAGGINISLANLAFVPVYDASVYGYFNNNSVAVKPAYVNMLAGSTTVVASGAGLGSNGTAPGLNVQFLGGVARINSSGVRPYLASNGFTYVALDLGFNLFGGPGAQHLVFTYNNFLHVLPAGIIATQQNPPTVTGVAANADGTVTVTGANWNSDSLIYFDGLPAVISSLDAKAGSAVVTPPAGASNQTAVITVYNTDGQNSQFVQSASPVTYSYGPSAAPSISVITPSAVPAGSEAAIDITSSSFSFIPGKVAVGFGTSDIVVRRIFVLGPNHLVADVSVSSGAALTITDVSVISGFQMAVAPGAFRILPAVSGQPVVVPVLNNDLPGLTGAYPGAVVTFYGSNLVAPNTPLTLTIAGQTITPAFSSATQVNLQLPSNLPIGPTLLTLSNGVSNAIPVMVNIDTTPAGISAIQNGTGGYVDIAHPVHGGDLVVVSLTSFSPAPNSVIQIGVAGSLHNPLQVTQVGSGTYQVSFLLNTNEALGVSQPLIVYLDGRSSYPATLPVASASGAFTSGDQPGFDQSGN